MLQKVREAYGARFFAVQVQARPPGKQVQDRSLKDIGGFVDGCNDMGIAVQLFSPTGALVNGFLNDVVDASLIERRSDFVRAYMRRYINRSRSSNSSAMNTLIVGSAFGSSLHTNYDLCQEELQGGRVEDFPQDLLDMIKGPLPRM